MTENKCVLNIHVFSDEFGDCTKTITYSYPKNNINMSKLFKIRNIIENKLKVLAIDCKIYRDLDVYKYFGYDIHIEITHLKEYLQCLYRLDKECFFTELSRLIKSALNIKK